MSEEGGRVTEARLRTFVALADTGSVRAAARRLYVTESAVSAAVAALTRDLGVPLVRKEGRGLRLTAAGAAYAGYARQVLGLLEEGRAAARGAADPGRGTLRLAAVTTAADQLLPELLASFRERWPDVELTLEVGPRRQVWSSLAAHEADLVLAGRPPAGLAATVLARRPNELVVVGAPHLADGFTPAGTPWVMREPGSGTRASADAYLAEREASPPRLVLGSNGAVIAGAAAGLGVALVSRDAVGSELDAGRLVVVDAPGMPLDRPWHAVGGAAPSATTLLFVRHLLDAPGWSAPGGSGPDRNGHESAAEATGGSRAAPTAGPD
ncbi:LysR substrate-binding domain-containing protein [Actinomadura livida]|uniref:DNA-binding transcriptional LysR family regulator n=1 Tax=Actinomadura livida TaxID=79909 RepID=A0A7W7IBE5_9ACTN|nr:MULTISPECIES: LysR substrate-binding domain-containing protein [Actinomadura]MBB4773994.1 DNA-binding transcriptional LysR family regulator [Actinomadura catellatispora]GGT85646.1 LysR family transcriptional regulator [Actinomadura livida]